MKLTTASKKGEGQISVKVGDSMLHAADIAREAENLSDDFFVFIHYENCEEHVRKFLTPIILRSQMKWVLRNDGVIYISIPGEGFHESFFAYEAGEFFQECNFDLNPEKRINGKIDRAFALMRNKGMHFSRVVLVEDVESRCVNFHIVASKNFGREDVSLVPWHWL